MIDVVPFQTAIARTHSWLKYAAKYMFDDFSDEVGRAFAELSEWIFGRKRKDDGQREAG